MKIKICGITNAKDALYAIEKGADFIGLILAPHHSTTVSDNDLPGILEVVKRGNKKSVAIFQNQDLYNVKSLIKKYSIDCVQLHGNESIEYVKKLRQMIPVMKVFHPESTKPVENIKKQIKSYQADYIILDRKIQGKGQLVDMEMAKNLAKEFPVFLAGGLTPENVFEIAEIVKPHGVDVSSGIRTNGVLDRKKVEKFIKIVRSSSRPER